MCCSKVMIFSNLKCHIPVWVHGGYWSRYQTACEHAQCNERQTRVTYKGLNLFYSTFNIIRLKIPMWHALVLDNRTAWNVRVVYELLVLRSTRNIDMPRFVNNKTVPSSMEIIKFNVLSDFQPYDLDGINDNRTAIFHIQWVWQFTYRVIC